MRAPVHVWKRMSKAELVRELRQFWALKQSADKSEREWMKLLAQFEKEEK